MGLRDLTSRDAVVQAIEECDRLGRDAFLAEHGFGRAREYVLVYNGKEYDSKAIAGVAHGYQFPERGPLRSSEFAGGESTVKRQLERLGFQVRKLTLQPALPALEVGRVYTWEELGRLFGFEPGYIGAAGGMVGASAHGALLLITHPGGGRSFNYEDFWDGDDLIYTGRGKRGDQTLTGPNADVAANAKALLVFEAGAPRQLRFLGEAHCTDFYWSTGIDQAGQSRRILRFRLAFSTEGARKVSREAAPRAGNGVPHRLPPHRKPRPFDPSRLPTPPTPGAPSVTPEERAQMQEKVNSEHHALLVALHGALGRDGWEDIEEIHGAIDLQARKGSCKVIFEAKTLSGDNEVSQTRSALSQLLEYRHFYGQPGDRLSLVTNAPVEDSRVRFLEAMGVAVVWLDAGVLRTAGKLARDLLGDVLAR